LALLVNSDEGGGDGDHDSAASAVRIEFEASNRRGTDGLDGDDSDEGVDDECDGDIESLERNGGRLKILWTLPRAAIHS